MKWLWHIGLGWRDRSGRGASRGQQGLQALYMRGCQNDGPFLGPYYNAAPIIEGSPKRDHNFNNHPHVNELPRGPVRALGSSDRRVQGIPIAIGVLETREASYGTPADGKNRSRNRL